MAALTRTNPPKCEFGRKSGRPGYTSCTARLGRCLILGAELVKPGLRSSLFVGAAAMGLSVSMLGTAATQPLSMGGAPISLAALIVQGSSTNQSGGGIPDFFQGKFAQPADTVVVNFLLGPFGIWQQLVAYSADDDNVVLSSGWGAANASALASILAVTDPALLQDTTWILDNNVAAPNGGFGTRYPAFALIGVNPVPPPTNTGATIVSIQYEYDLNSNAPKYILNSVTDLNSLMAYFDRRLTQQSLGIPVDAQGNPIQVPAGTDCSAECTYDAQVDDGNGGLITAHVTKVDGVTYVSYDHPGGLPLVAPVRTYGGDLGNTIADVTEPALKAVVDWGYPNNDPLANPGDLERVGLIPSAAENKTFVKDFVAGVKEGLDTLDGGQTPETSSVLDQAADVRTPLLRERPKPLTNVLRQGSIFEPGDAKPAGTARGGVKHAPISVESALKKLSKAFSPKHADEQGQAPAGDAPSDGS